MLHYDQTRQYYARQWRQGISSISNSLKIMIERHQVSSTTPVGISCGYLRWSSKSRNFWTFAPDGCFTLWRDFISLRYRKWTAWNIYHLEAAFLGETIRFQQQYGNDQTGKWLWVERTDLQRSDFGFVGWKTVLSETEAKGKKQSWGMAKQLIWNMVRMMTKPWEWRQKVISWCGGETQTLHESLFQKMPWSLFHI